MIGCLHCSHQIESVEDACAWCGRWQNGHMPMCETHPSAPSVGLCVVCCRPVCGTCAQNYEGRLFCSETDHRTFAATHALACVVTSEFDADWLTVVLARAGITATVHSFRDHVASWWYPLEDAVRIFVPVGQAEAARSVLSELDDLPTELRT